MRVRFVGIASVFLIAGAAAAQPPSALEQRVQALIRDLGDASFAKREAAHKALLAEGYKIVPLLDRAKDAADLETVRRLERIRYQLVGYLDDITVYLNSHGPGSPDTRPEISPNIISLVAAHQPKAGEFLLKIIADAKDHRHRLATHVFCATWQSGPGSHLEKYFQSSFRLQAFHRQRYPHGVDAYIETRYWQQHGWTGWPDKLQWQTRTTHFLDGKQHGKPFIYTYPGAAATTGWINVGKLERGKHVLRFEVEFVFTHQGAKHKGTVRSPEFEFTVVAPAPPDDLIAATNAEEKQQVRQALRFLEYEGQDQEDKNRIIVGEDFRQDPWRPQITWQEKGQPRGLHVPEWTLIRALPVDLCFDVELRDVQSGKRFKGVPLVVKRGQTSRGYFSPRDIHGFCAGKDGFVELEIHLQPSRSVALTDPEITSYFGWPITSKRLRAKIVNGIAEPPPQK
jgi:hypothetical protein